MAHCPRCRLPETCCDCDDETEVEVPVVPKKLRVRPSVGVEHTGRYPRDMGEDGIFDEDWVSEAE